MESKINISYEELYHLDALLKRLIAIDRTIAPKHILQISSSLDMKLNLHQAESILLGHSEAKISHKKPRGEADTTNP